MVKNLPATWEIWVQSLGQEDSLEKERQPTPVFLPGESHGQKSLVDYSSWGCKESDRTEPLSLYQKFKEYVMQNLYKIFLKIEGEEILSVF